VEELASRAKLQDDVVVLASFNEFDELDNIWVVELSHDLDFLENIRALLVVSIGNLACLCGGVEDIGLGEVE